MSSHRCGFHFDQTDRLLRQSANFPAVMPPSNVFHHRHLSDGLSAPDVSHEVFRPTAPSAGPIHVTAGFTFPLCSVLRVWPPSRRFSPGPALPTLFQIGCAPGLGPSEVARSCGGAVFPQPRTDSWFESRPPARASTAQRRVPPPLGFAPQVCPSHDLGCYPVAGSRLSWAFSSLRFVLRPAWLVLRRASARWLFRHPVTRVFGVPLGVSIAGATIPIRFSVSHSRQTPRLATRPDQKSSLRFLHLFAVLNLKAEWSD